MVQACRPFSRAAVAHLAHVRLSARLKRASIRLPRAAIVIRTRRIIASSRCEDDARGRAREIVRKLRDALSAHAAGDAESALSRTRRIAGFAYGAGAGVAAFHRTTIDAVVVLSVFLNPGGGSLANCMR